MTVSNNRNFTAEIELLFLEFVNEILLCQLLMNYVQKGKLYIHANWKANTKEKNAVYAVNNWLVLQNIRNKNNINYTNSLSSCTITCLEFSCVTYEDNPVAYHTQDSTV